MANVKVKENHLTFGGVSYFRGHADDVDLGSIGEKRTPIAKQNYLEVKDRIPIGLLTKVKSTVVEIDFDKDSKSAFNTAIKAIVKGVPVGINASATFSKLSSGELKLVKLSVSNNEMMKAANKAREKVKYLINWGNDARIAHQVFIAMDAEYARHFDNDVSVTLSGEAGKMEATVSGGVSASGTTTVKLGKGTCFAYLLAKIDWDAKQKKNKSKIVDLDDDQWGFG
jgi:hypothetical protein